MTMIDKSNIVKIRPVRLNVDGILIVNYYVYNI